MPPYRVLQIDLFDRDVNKVKEALASPEAPKVVVVPSEANTPEAATQFLKDCGLWFVKE